VNGKVNLRGHAFAADAAGALVVRIRVAQITSDAVKGCVDLFFGAGESDVVGLGSHFHFPLSVDGTQSAGCALGITPGDYP
jgi:hypothetical protein